MHTNTAPTANAVTSQIPEISFAASRKDGRLITQIVIRARKVWPGADGLELSMDITATHLNGCPLDLQKLLDFDAFNFAHDVGGIRHHINRETGKLDGHFMPRCALVQS